MDGCYVWQESVGDERFILKGFMREESFKWVARIVDNTGQERWREEFSSSGKARAGLVQRVPDDARFLKGAIPE